MKTLLRSAQKGEHSEYTRLRDWSDPHSAERRDFINKLWEQYEPLAPKGFNKKLQKEFHKRWWEMYLAVAMTHLGFHPILSKFDQGPDIHLDLNGSVVFIEAVAPSGGEKSDRVPLPVHNGVAELPERECLLRFTNALKYKCNTFQEYINKGIVSRDACLIIALSATNLNQFGTLLDGAHPAPLSVLAGAGLTVVTKEGGCPPFSCLRSTLYRDSGGPVNASLFDTPEFQIISGVLYSPVDLWNAPPKAEETLSLFVNPAADQQIPVNFLQKFKYWIQENRTDEEVNWRMITPNG